MQGGGRNQIDPSSNSLNPQIKSTGIQLKITEESEDKNVSLEQAGNQSREQSRIDPYSSTKEQHEDRNFTLLKNDSSSEKKSRAEEVKSRSESD